MKLFLAALLLCSIFSGCVSRPSSIIASTSPLPPGLRGTIKTKGSDCQYRLLGLIPLNAGPSTSQALDRAKSKAQVDVLTDVTVDHGGGYYLLFSNQCVRVNGMGVSRDSIREVERFN